MRVILFTGKGGVGKTTVAAATAVQCAERGLRTVIMSTDPAHSLADSFGVELDDGLTAVAPLLAAQQLDATTRMEESWEEIRGFLQEIFAWSGLDGLEAEELAVIPGLDELFALTDVRTHASSGDFDVVIVDCAPTAETIRLLSLPEVLSWYMDRLFPLGRRLNKLVGPMLGRLAGVPVASDEVFEATERFHQRLAGIRELLSDPEVTSLRLVVNPEKMVVAEARRTFTYVSLFGYRVDAVVANRVLPDDVTDPWFDRWREVQAEQLAEIDTAFAPTPILRLPLAPTEVIGLERLSELADQLYGDAAAEAVLHDGDGLSFARWEDRHVVSVPVHLDEPGELEVNLVGGELVIRIGPYRRNVALPDSLRRRPVERAALDDGTLRVIFEADVAR